ncbi:hypothetical protein EJ08DRAFT_257099 [Tothia fuscella]|uniref:Protein kinase domain-containing protein n=1 Tax=Tothia fuscella TaxID=1048955 RepID=A0A9P4NQU0_9PEZI|nr:hypothetical protein EJ08DRAFT_257099 [Tothia fuscella]
MPSPELPTHTFTSKPLSPSMFTQASNTSSSEDPSDAQAEPLAIDIPSALALLPPESEERLRSAYGLVKLPSSQGNHSVVALALPHTAITPSPQHGPPTTTELVVVKIIQARDNTNVATSENEVHIAKRLTESTGPGRQHIVPLLLADLTSPCAWFSMPLVNGCELKAFLNEFKFASNDDGTPNTTELVRATIIYHLFIQMMIILDWMHTRSAAPYTITSAIELIAHYPPTSDVPT